MYCTTMVYLWTILQCLFAIFLVPNAFAKDKNRVPKPTGKFLLLTDFHIDNYYDQRGDPTNMCHRNETIGKNRAPTASSPGPFGSRNCDPPLALIDFMVKEAQKQLAKPDYIIWTGDNAAHDEYNETRFFDTLESANSAILRHFPDAIVIPVVGNHESVPGNDFSDNGTNNFAGIFERWQKWVGESAKETFLRGGYYLFRSPLDSSAFIILNTNFYYVGNKEIDHFEHPDDPAGQFAFLEQQLGEVKRNNSTVHILAHIPIGAYEMYKIDREDWKPEMARRYNQRLYQIFVDYAPWIRWMLFGHLHTDTFRIIKAPDGTPVQRMFLNPAVTPLFNLNNPAFRVFEYNPENMDIEDIKTFFVELEALNENGAEKSEVKLEYSFREAYRIRSPLNAETVDNLLEQMRRNATVFDQYFNYSSVQWMARKLNETERAAHLCVMEFVDFDQLQKCVDRKNATTVRWPYLTLLLGSLIVASIAFFAAFLLVQYIRKKSVNNL